MDNNDIRRIILKNKNTVNIVLPKDRLFNINTAIGKPMSQNSGYKK